MRFGSDFGRFWPPKTPPIAEEDSTFRGLEVDLFLACYLCHILVASKTVQEAPKKPQDPFKRLQEAPKSAPGGSKRASRDPKSRPRGLYNSKDALLRCPAADCTAGMPKNGGRAAVSPQRGRQ